ncbi:hypothetical protein SDJN02_00457, partial [Cucurbita argyrosperma subsp. argyrosperma]
MKLELESRAHDRWFRKQGQTRVHSQLSILQKATAEVDFERTMQHRFQRDVLPQSEAIADDFRSSN